MTRIVLGFNCNCFTNRYDEPEEWTRICRETGIREVMFNIDLIDPYWPWELQQRLCERTLNACAKNGIHIRCSFGGHHGHQHYLGHYDADVRAEAEAFFRRAIRQTAYLGGHSFGTCFAIQTICTDNDAALRAQIMESALTAYERLAEYGAEQGLTALAYEMTSVRRETCATFEENDYVLERLKDAAIPMCICLDMGHRNMAGSAEEQDPLAWILRYGNRCDVIDCQQTDIRGSHHWPFTAENNEKGIIRGGDVVEAIRASDAEDIMLAFELRTPAFYPHEQKHYENLAESVAYWRQWVKE